MKNTGAGGHDVIYVPPQHLDAGIKTMEALTKDSCFPVKLSNPEPPKYKVTLLLFTRRRVMEQIKT
jgi:hypothetical protein